MDRIKALLAAADRFQQRHRPLAFGYAVVKKFGDDQAGNLAALLAYYAFFSIFPLLLVLVTVLGIVLRGNPALQASVLNSALKNFPVIGPQLRHNVHSLNRTGIGLAVGLIGTFLGARGVANAAQNAFNSLWNVPYTRRPGFPWNQLRSLGIIVVFGGGVLVTTALQTVIQSLHIGHLPIGLGLKAAGYAVATGLNIGVFVLGFRLATAKDVSLRTLASGAVIAALAWEVLQGFGTFLVDHSLRNASNVYGTFGLVIGLLSWIYLQAQITFYAVEVDVVRSRRLWPRSLTQPPLTRADEKAYQEYARTEQRRPEQSVEVSFDPQAGR